MDEPTLDKLRDTIAEYGEITVSWLARNLVILAQILCVIIIGLIISHFIQRIVYGLINSVLKRNSYQTAADRKKRVETLAKLGIVLLRFFIWLTVIVVIINILGINLTPILASAGIIGIAVGIGSQKLIGDLVAGIFIISENQYRVGDFVELEGVSGTVEDITLRTTVLRDISGAVHHVPNGQITVTTNRSMGFGYIDIDIVVHPETNIQQLEEIINKVGTDIHSLKIFKNEVIEPPHFVRVVDVNGNGITVKISGKTSGGKQLEIKSELMTALKTEFDNADIRFAKLPPLRGGQPIK